ncbi:CarD family transcriptional regulator [Crassaminicella thermophila]|uniref:CarD family transcriptional regulator n=1 Tax=Crassaminicella thermophila TaxID=2599308 RepID=A0A5C0SC97_CRATE|nr:CarD family transcriptional regulator [Crassaminicella thermophila]QEK11138.1 CarD family transcriptional regulator [Crassaminicella thermophila]
MFNIGDKVVYPMHGAGIIESIEEKEILGTKRKYYIMRMPLGDMKVMIPLDNVNDVGLRQIISMTEVDQVVAVLNDDISKMPKNWNRRYRANMDKIKSGDIYEVAMVVRNLTLRDREKGLSTGERKMLANAKQILISEIVLAKGMKEKDVEDLIDTAIQ